MPTFFRQKIDFSGKHCYVTGGSSGLGLALAEELARKGAHITIVARDVRKLKSSVDRIKSHASSPQQRILYISSDLSQFKSSAQACSQATKLHGGHVADYVFLCAGTSRPGHFIEMSEKDLMHNLNMTYLPALHTSSVAIRQMIKSNVQNGRIIFVSSFLGLNGFAGYTGYSAGKYAIRGLADCLRSETLLYEKSHNLKIHLYIPAGILSPGYEEEEKTKPAVTRKIEDGDTPMKPEECVGNLIAGMEKGYYQITNDLITDLVRTQSRGGVTWNNFFWDLLLSFIGLIGLPIWRMYADGIVRGHAAVHAREVKINMDGLESDDDHDDDK